MRIIFLACQSPRRDDGILQRGIGSRLERISRLELNMSFSAECLFCRLLLRGVPDHLLGISFECPRCRNCFTLAPTANPLAETSRPSEPDARQPLVSPTIVAAERQAMPSRCEKRINRDAPVRPGSLAESVIEKGLDPTDRSLARPKAHPDYPSLASFLLGCFAFLAAATLHACSLTLSLGLAGLALGAFVLFTSSSERNRRLLPASGSVVSLAAVLGALVVPGWLGLSPLWGEPTAEVRRGPAVLSLSGKEVFRRPTEGEALRVDASRDALHFGDVRLRVRSAVVGLADFEPLPGKFPPQERCLLLSLRITNAGIARRLRYNGWGGGVADEELVLRDGQGKTYREKVFPPGWVLKGRARAASIPPGKFLDDVVAFEAPRTTFDSLSLELPGAPVGVEGKLKVEIPKQMIVFRR
jgi:hypothetical protein